MHPKRLIASAISLPGTPGKLGQSGRLSDEGLFDGQKAKRDGHSMRFRANCIKRYGKLTETLDDGKGFILNNLLRPSQRRWLIESGHPLILYMNDPRDSINVAKTSSTPMYRLPDQM